jgi:hypothetical protein
MIDIAHSADLKLAHLTIAAAAATGATSAAIGLSGVILSAGVHDCILAAEQAVVATPGKLNYLLTANLGLADNVLLCGERGISLDGACLHYGQLRIADNLVLGCTQAGVIANGAALPTASVAIEGNVLQVVGVGIMAGTDQLRIADNEIVAMAGKVVGHGIHLVPGVYKGALDPVWVTGNRLRGQRGHGIVITRRLGRATFRANTVEHTGGGALVMLPGASADYIAVEGNQFVNIGVGFNHDALPFVGVLLLATRRADVTGNLLVNIARQALLSPLRVGIMTLAIGEQRIAGNRLSGIGPTGSFNLRTVGIGIAPGFADAAVDDNTVARIDSDADLRTVGIGIAPGFADAAVDDNTVARIDSDVDKPGIARWQALLILGSLGVGTQTQAGIAVPGVVMLPTKSGLAYLTASQIALLSGAPGTAMVRGNRMRSQNSLIPAAEILAVQGCLFDQNDIRVLGGDGDGELTGRVLCDHASIANNRLIGSNGRATFALFCDEKKYSVLGNLRTAPIQVNDTLDHALPPPWNTLNVSI